MSKKNDSSGPVYDLTERTAVFGEAVIEYLKGIPRGDITSPLIRQLVRSATSVGANYTEADEAGSKKEFRHRISICKRESKETRHWLRMLAAAVPETKADARPLWQEAMEFNKIFATIHRNSDNHD
ncbi:MAG: four helix bundle protein [Pirellulales bacterium]